MQQLKSPSGVTVSFETAGSGPPLVLVHGSFSDHRTNWAEVIEPLRERYTVHAIARRGRGETDATQAHRVPDEAEDVAALIDSIDEPVTLLGHSYGAQVALAAAARLPERTRKLILYEAPHPQIVREQAARIEELASAADWEGVAATFFQDALALEAEDFEALHASAAWNDIVADAEPSLGDIRALDHYPFRAEDFGHLRMPVLLQIGSESPRTFFVTDALAEVLTDVRIETFPGQAHEAMVAAPAMYVESVSRFLD